MNYRSNKCSAISSAKSALKEVSLRSEHALQCMLQVPVPYGIARLCCYAPHNAFQKHWRCHLQPAAPRTLAWPHSTCSVTCVPYAGQGLPTLLYSELGYEEQYLQVISETEQHTRSKEAVGL